MLQLARERRQRLALPFEYSGYALARRSRRCRNNGYRNVRHNRFTTDRGFQRIDRTADRKA